MRPRAQCLPQLPSPPQQRPPRRQPCRLARPYSAIADTRRKCRSGMLTRMQAYPSIAVGLHTDQSTSAGRGVPNTGSGSWPSLQPCGGYGHVAHLIDPVAALAQSNGGGLDAGEMRLRTLNERPQL